VPKLPNGSPPGHRRRSVTKTSPFMRGFAPPPTLALPWARSPIVPPLCPRWESPCRVTAFEGLTLTRSARRRAILWPRSSSQEVRLPRRHRRSRCARDGAGLPQGFEDAQGEQPLPVAGGLKSGEANRLGIDFATAANSVLEHLSVHSRQRRAGGRRRTSSARNH
jgi:hypothetical protein